MALSRCARDLRVAARLHGADMIADIDGFAFASGGQLR
jgi:hypothetical protein